MACILLIDDDPAVRFLISDILEECGYEVITAVNGTEGLRSLALEQPDLVITDIIMPDMNGIEVIMKVKSANPEGKIIALSAGGRITPERYLETAMEVGAQKVLTKPVAHQELTDAVREVLET